jgi:hypothetical protein
MANVSGVIYQLPREIGEKCVCVVGGSGPGGKLWVSHMQCTDWGDRIINQTQERNSERSISIFFFLLLETVVPPAENDSYCPSNKLMLLARI